MDIKLDPATYVQDCADKKAYKVSLSYKENFIIGADTIVVFDNQILGKPKDKLESYSMLKMLSGQKHKVFTGLSIQNYNKKTELNGPKGPEPTRFGDWEKNGRCSDF